MPRVDLYRDVPGYADAVRREDELRAVPLLGLEERIAGLPALPMTLRHYQWLAMAGSPFLTNLDAETIVEKPFVDLDITLFLWVVSPKFKPGNSRAKARFFKANRHVLKMNALEVVKEIKVYVDEAFLDSGADGPGSGRSYYSMGASLVGYFHRHYGLPIDCWENSWLRNLFRKITGQPNVLDIPLKIAWQLVRVHRKTESPDAILHNRLSQPCIDAWLRDLNKKN